jgi:preprotein translocase subunit YajC
MEPRLDAIAMMMMMLLLLMMIMMTFLLLTRAEPRSKVRRQLTDLRYVHQTY